MAEDENSSRASKAKAEAELANKLMRWSMLYSKLHASGTGTLDAAEERELWSLTADMLLMLPTVWHTHPLFFVTADEKKRRPSSRFTIDELFEFAGKGLADCLAGTPPPPLATRAGNVLVGSQLEAARYASAYGRLVEGQIIPDDDPAGTIGRVFGVERTRLRQWKKQDPGPCLDRLKKAVIEHPPGFRRFAALHFLHYPATTYKNRRYRSVRKKRGRRG